MMNTKILLKNLLRATRSNSAARYCAIWQVAKDSNGHKIVLPAGSFRWRMIGHAYVIFAFAAPDVWAGATGEYEGSFKVNVIGEAIETTETSAVQPNLGETFMLQNLRDGFDPFPRWTKATRLDAISSTALIQRYDAMEAQPEELTGVDVDRP